jgi:hypothetical protein
MNEKFSSLNKTVTGININSNEIKFIFIPAFICCKEVILKPVLFVLLNYLLLKLKGKLININF